tara:strand:+ start:646 stop:1254 length:609 start_codon:yes stop_codon:yes gene_type:complete
VTNTLEIFNKRRQIKNFKSEVPKKEIIEEILQKSFDVVPSKQNLIPYKVVVLGPNNPIEKDILEDLTSLAIVDNRKVFHNAPYIIFFSTRLSKPNKLVRHLMDKGHSYPKCDINKYKENSTLLDVNIEIGMFATIFTALCNEKNIDVGYCSCYVQNDNRFAKHLLIDTEDKILFVLYVGYDDNTRKNTSEEKPKIDEVIFWK